MFGTRGILAAHGSGSSESTIEAASTQCNGADLFPFTAKIMLDARLLNRPSTIVQQLFNSRVLDVLEGGL
jgi:hypothetical protein